MQERLRKLMTSLEGRSDRIFTRADVDGADTALMRELERFRVPGSGPRRFSLDLMKAALAEPIEFRPRTIPGADVMIPKSDPTFIPARNWQFVMKVLKSGMFLPVYIWGPPGCGKTSTVREACARLGKPFYRVSVSRDTTEEDFVGSLRIRGGDTVWQDGPVISAYRSGGVCLLDEIDQNNYALMSLQPVLEGRPFLVKTTGELVEPAPGFQLFATANTKGDGTCWDYSTTMHLNSAFLDRFAVVLKQDVSTESEDKAIAEACVANLRLNIPQSELETLLKWNTQLKNHWRINPAENIFMTPRRLCFILKARLLYGSMKKALRAILSKFTDEQGAAALKLWDAVSPDGTEEGTDENIQADL